MRIAFVHFYTLRLRRGIETLVLSLANALVTKGHDVSILTASRTVSPLVIPLPSVHVHEFPTFKYKEELTIVPFYIQHLLQYDYDAIVIFFADFGEAVALNFVRRWKKLNLNLYLCYPYSAAPHRYDSFNRSGLAEHAHRICADSSFVAAEAQSFFGRDVPVIPAGTDPVRFCPDPAKRSAFRKELGIGEDQVVLLNVSSLEERKGVHRVLRVLTRLQSVISGLRYLILGEGPMRGQLEEMAAKADGRAGVIFGGVTSDLVPFYNAADIFVMWSEHEANSVACLEAMACGLPVIATAGGGFLEVVDAESGILVTRGDEAAFEQAVLCLARDAERRTKMGKVARTNVIARYSWEHIADRAVQVFSASKSNVA